MFPVVYKAVSIEKHVQVASSAMHSSLSCLQKSVIDWKTIASALFKFMQIEGDSRKEIADDLF